MTNHKWHLLNTCLGSIAPPYVLLVLIAFLKAPQALCTCGIKKTRVNFLSPSSLGKLEQNKVTTKHLTSKLCGLYVKILRQQGCKAARLLVRKSFSLMAPAEFCSERYTFDDCSSYLCCITNYHRPCSLTNICLISRGFCQPGAWPEFSWVLHLTSSNDANKLLTGICFFLEHSVSSKLQGCWKNAIICSYRTVFSNFLVSVRGPFHFLESLCISHYNDHLIGSWTMWQFTSSKPAKRYFSSLKAQCLF